MRLFLILPFIVAMNAYAAVQSSANYTVLCDVVDAGGTRATSSNYANDGSIGGFGGLITASTPQETDRVGYAGQLYEVTAFTLTAASTNLIEDSSMAVCAVQFLDDGTVSPVNNFAQWSYTGPIVGSGSAGTVIAAEVYQNTSAIVQANLEGWTASLNLWVIFTGMFPGYNQITSQLLNSGNMSLSFVGYAGSNYALDRTYNLEPPVNWEPQTTNSAGFNGGLNFTNSPNPATNNFWRIRSVP
jgi:hypothetical protein